MRVKDCMGIKDIIQAEPETNLNEIAQLMDTNHVGCIPICKKEEIVGFITDRDIVTRAIASNLDCNTTKVSEIMNTNVIKTTPDTEIGYAIEVMAKNQIRRLPVIENNKVVGILSLGDIAVTLDEEDVGHTIGCICEDETHHCD